MINDPVTVNLESVVDSIMRQIGPMSYPEDADMIRDDSEAKLKRGWLPSEIIEFQRCTEHVDKTIPEDVALARMDAVHDAVKKRLGVKFLFLSEPRSIGW